MIRIILAFFVFFLVLATSALLVDEKGYILIAMGDITVESTVVSAILLLCLVLVSLFVLLNILRGGLNFGLSGWHKVVFANRNRAQKQFKQGVLAFLLEDYAKAEQLLDKSALASGQANIAWLMAAVAADKQQLSNHSKHYLEQINQLANAEDSALAPSLITIKLLMAQQDYAGARQLIDTNHKLIGHEPKLLMQELALCLHEHRFAAAVDYLTQARKQKLFTEQQISQWEYQAYYGLFQQQINEQSSDLLQQTWQGLTRKLKQREGIVFAYCQVLAEQQITEPLTELLAPVLKQGASDAFLQKVIQLPIRKPDPLIAIIQRHLQKDPHDLKWLRVLAHLACTGHQWQMAEKAFFAMFNNTNQQNRLPSEHDLKQYARVLSQQGQYQKANQLLLTQNTG
jgi:HemY protein